MKKFVITGLIGLISLISIFAFAACGESGKVGNESENGDIKYTVTQEEWSEAFAIFDPDKVEENKDKLNFKIIFNLLEKEQTEEEFYQSELLAFAVDGTNKTVFLQAQDIYSGKSLEFYYFEKDGNHLIYVESETQESEDDFTEIVSGWLLNGDFGNIGRGGTYCKFSDFTFEGKTNKYCGTVNIDGYVHYMALKFENGRLVELYMEYNGADFNAKQTYTVEYGTTVKIPDYILGTVN